MDYWILQARGWGGKISWHREHWWCHEAVHSW